MSDYKTMRLKKNAEIENAMANVNKDLYNWKQTANMLKINTKSTNSTSSVITTPKFKSFDGTSAIRSGSLRDISRICSGGHSRKNSNTNNNVKLRPISGGRGAKKFDDFSDFDANDPNEDLDNGSEFLTTFKKDSRSGLTSERQYLYTNKPTSNLTARKNAEEIEAELVRYLFFEILRLHFPIFCSCF